MIDAAVQYGVERLGASPEQAERAFQKHFSKVLKQQQNLEAVVEEAKIDLIEGQQDYEDVSGPMSEEFFDRFEAYSMNASTDELRQRWGRVLASEIRRPGTFSAKVLRVVDEVDAQTARLFERLCASRVGNAVYKPFAIELTYPEKVQLVTAGLLVEPGLTGQHTVMTRISLRNGRDYYVAGGEGLYCALPAEELEGDSSLFDTNLLVRTDDQIGIPVYVLTDEAVAISSILSHSEREIVMRYAQKAAEHVKEKSILMLIQHPDGRLSGCGVATPAEN